MIIFVGGQAFSVKRLNGAQWGVCLVLGVISIPIGVVIRLIPDSFIQRLIPNIWGRKKTPLLFVSDEESRYQWNPALEEIRDQLTFLKTVRGGRLKNIKHKLQHPETLLPRSRSGSRSREESVPATPVSEEAAASPPPATPESRSRNRARSRSDSAFGPAAAMAGIVAGSIAGWSPIERSNGDNDSLRFSRNGSTAHSGIDDQPGIEVHPDTRPDDPVITDYSVSSTTPPSQNPDLIPYFDFAPPDRAPSSRGRRSSSRRSRSNTLRSQSQQSQN